MSKRALVVDDDHAMVKTLSDVLRLKGWDVTTALSGDVAVQAATDQDFDVVIMDVKMPGMDGVTAFTAMKTVRPDIRVVLMTAYAAPDRIAEAQRQGVVRVMSKPLNITSLLLVLDESLSGQRPVLVVDHDATFLWTLADVLRMRGYEVAEAVYMGHAIRLLSERRPIAVLLHLQGGTDAAMQAVQAVREISPAAALILYSGRPGAADEMGQVIPSDWVHAYLQKPFAIDQLTGVLDEISHAR